MHLVFCIFNAAIRSLDLGFLMSANGPNDSEMLNKQKAIVKEILKSHNVGPDKTHVGILQKTKPLKLSMKIGQFKEKQILLDEIDKLRPGEPGELSGALKFAKDEMFDFNNGARRGFRKSLVVFVTNEEQEDKNALKTIGRDLLSKDVNIVVVALNQTADPEKLKAISPENQVIFFPPQLDKLDLALYPVTRATFPGNSIQRILD